MQCKNRLKLRDALRDDPHAFVLRVTNLRLYLSLKPGVLKTSQLLQHGPDFNVRTWFVVWQHCRVGVHRLLKKSGLHLRITGTRMGTQNKFHTEDQQTVGDTVQNLATTAKWLPGFVRPCCGESFVIRGVTMWIVPPKNDLIHSLDFPTFMA